MEPNVITLGSHWLNAERAASPAHHTVSLGTYAVTQGVRLRSMLPAETFFSRALVVFQPLSWSMWIALVLGILTIAIIVEWYEHDSKEPGKWAYESVLSCFQATTPPGGRSVTRFAGLVHGFAALVFVAVYTANMASFMMLEPVQTVKGFGALPEDAVVCVPRYHYELDPTLPLYYVPNLQSDVLEGRPIKLIDSYPDATSFDNCSVILDWETWGKQVLRDDPTCKSYMANQGEPLFPYPNVLFLSPSTAPEVVAALNSVIAQIKLSGFVDLAFNRAYERTIQCPDHGFRELTLVDFSGIALLLTIAYAIVITERCARKATRRERGGDTHGVARSPALQDIPRPRMRNPEFSL